MNLCIICHENTSYKINCFNGCFYYKCKECKEYEKLKKNIWLNKCVICLKEQKFKNIVEKIFQKIMTIFYISRMINFIEKLLDKIIKKISKSNYKLVLGILFIIIANITGLFIIIIFMISSIVSSFLFCYYRHNDIIRIR